MLSSPSDDEVGGDQARSAPAMVAPPICRRSRRNPAERADLPRQSFRRIRRRRRLLSEQRSEPSDTASLASGAINTDQDKLERRRSACTAMCRSVVCHMSGIEAFRYAP